MAITVLPETQAQLNSPGSQFSRGLSGGIQQGLGMALQNMFEEKQHQRQMQRQMAINTQSASSLADQLGIQGDDRKSFVSLFGNLSPEKQVGALKSLSEAQIYNQFLQQGGQEPDINMMTGQSPQGMLGRQDFNQRFPDQQLSQQDSQKKEMSPVDTQRNNRNTRMESQWQVQPLLPQKPKKYPPIGVTAKAADIENRIYQKELDRNFSETKSYREGIEKQGEGAERSLQTLKKLDKLIDSGKLANPLIASLAKKYDFVGLLSPESQLFEKTMGEFLPSMADTYGARVTNQHERIFLNTLPRLQQTESGKKLLVDVLKKKSEADSIKYKIEREILKETRGIPPLNLRDMVEERSKPELERNYDEVIDMIAGGAKESSIPGRVTMIDQLGNVYDIPEEQVNAARAQGFESL